MHGRTLNGELAAENIADLLDAHERTLRWKEEDGAREREEIIRSADHFSPLGTDILRRHHGIAAAIVIDDGERYRYVVAREVLVAPETLSLGRRLHRWMRDVPVQLCKQWRLTGRESTDLPPASRTRDRYRSADGTWIGYESKGELKVGGWPEFSSWLRAFPGRYWQEEAIGRWYIASPVVDYYVDPDFHEPMEYDDVVRYLRDHYPPHPSGDPNAIVDLDLGTGRVFFRGPAYALAYAEDLKRTMHKLGVLCSPVAGIRGYTDRRRSAEGKPSKEEGARTNSGLPRLEKFGQEGLIFDLSTLEHRRRRSAELERRLGDRNIPDRRKAQIRRALSDERELERDAARNLECRPPEEIYGLALDLARERDRIAEEKRHAERLLDGVREGLPS